MISASEEADPLLIQVYRSAFKKEWGLRDEFVKTFLNIFRKSPNKIMDNQAKYLIYYLWKRYSYLSKGFTAIYIAFAVTTSINIVWCLDKNSCSDFVYFSNILYFSSKIISFVTYCLILLSELAVLSKKRLSHLKNTYNQLDMLILLLFFPVNIFFWFFKEKEEDLYLNALSTGYIALVFFRAITQLRSIDNVRYLVAMLQRVFGDMIPFVTVLASAIISLAVIEV